MTILDFASILGGFGILFGLTCLIAFRKHRSAVEKTHAEMRAILGEQKVEYSQQIAQLSRSLAVLESSAQNIEEAGARGLTRSVRSQAMQLIRSGMSPESAASALGIGRREMHLIARVSMTLK